MLFCDALLLAIRCLAFWYGAITVNHGICSFADFMKALNAILFGSFIY